MVEEFDTTDLEELGDFDLIPPVFEVIVYEYDENDNQTGNYALYDVFTEEEPAVIKAEEVLNLLKTNEEERERYHHNDTVYLRVDVDMVIHDGGESDPYKCFSKVVVF